MNSPGSRVEKNTRAHGVYKSFAEQNVPWVPETFSSADSGFCQVFIVTLSASPLVASAYGRRCVGLQPTPKIPAAGEKNLWYPG